jgi:LuxR family maltose regulon positive regulatory protein
MRATTTRRASSPTSWPPSTRLPRSLRARQSRPSPELINEIDRASSSTILILDDFQRIEGAAVRDVVSYLLEHQPSTLHVVIASRSDPLLPLARLRGKGELAELRAADLRFTPEEAATFLNQMMGLGLSAVDIDALESRTEGWIAGLQLAALSMREHSDVTGFIEAFTGSNRFVIDYLGEEVLQRQPEDVRSFLLRTAFLERMCASLCDALTGRTDSDEMLDALERDNLFLVPLDDERHWYRYHHLFADVLRARSLREDRDRVDDLHRLASAWHEVHDLPAEAIGYALSARDFLRAAHLIERALPDLRRRRRDTTLIAWLKLLPDDTTRRMPVLRAFSAWSMFVAQNLDGADRRFSEVEDALTSERRPRLDRRVQELTKLPATIAAYRAAIAQARGDIDATESHARRTLALSLRTTISAVVPAVASSVSRSGRRGDLESAVPTFRDAMASLEVAGHLTDAISGTVVMMDMLTVQGRRVAAGRRVRARPCHSRRQRARDGRSTCSRARASSAARRTISRARRASWRPTRHPGPMQAFLRTAIAGSSRCRGSRRPKAISTPPLCSSTRPSASTCRATSPTPARSPR